ncbi:aerobic respiration control sensor protein ArcB [Anaerotignum neopropionicum]|uniref:Stage 0 sporulation protein A homolog n=1 Tax=Anaerotignum neopropionicum TaxID=36847 RepID=A0A136WBE7_9FIRM|nr:PAS domain-containing hybrid sensor histidine kinase/response regulator [Anaerotignum neopropionicum]KXL51815.1 aerobic respiration control sensor protein ArcB [Anaerotignum neopropionicum]
MASVEKENLERLLNAIREVAVFVVCQDTQEILFCNNEAKKQEANETGIKFKDLWANQSAQWMEENTNHKGNYVTTIFDDTTKRMIRMAATNILWGVENVPAFAVMLTPIICGKDGTKLFILFEYIDVILSEGYLYSCMVNLTQNEYQNILPNFCSKRVIFSGKTYDELTESLNQRVHPIYDGEIKGIYGKERLLQDYAMGKRRISSDFLLQDETGAYRWVRGNVVFPENTDTSDVIAMMLWKEVEKENDVAQQLLLEQEALFDSLPGYVLKIRIGDEIVLMEASKTFYEFFYETDGNFQVGDNVLSEDREYVITEIKEKGKMGQPITFECRVCNKEGKLIWVQCEGKLVGHQMGWPVYLLILLNITTIKEVQAQLMQERERYRLAVEDMAVGFFEYYAKEDFLVYHGTRRDGVGTLKIRDFIKNIKELSYFPAETAELIVKILHGESTGAEIEVYVNQHKQKEWIFCQGNAIVENGRVKKIIGTLRSIDAMKKEQIRVEKKLQAEQKKHRMSNQRFLQVVNQLYDLIIEVDIKSRKTFIWKDSKDYITFSSTEKKVFHFLTSDCFNLIHDEYREAARKKFSVYSLEKEFHNGKKEVMLEVPVRSSMGVYRWYRIQVQLIEGEPDSTRVMVYFKDIDEQKSREAQHQNTLKDALKLAEQANAAKGEFLSRMSHDIRTPLNAIMGMAAIAQANLECKEKAEDCLKKINTSSKYLLALINDILDMSKIEGGKTILNIKEFDIHELLYESVVYGYTQGQMKEQEFLVQIKGEKEGIFEGDSLRISQILINLLSNAFKYTPSKGKISLIAAVEILDESRVLLQIEVQDNGIGIQKSFLKKLFLPFEQGKGGLDAGGTGLGLAISQNLAMLMGGQIFVESEEDKGSVFRVELPLKRKLEAAVSPIDKKMQEGQADMNSAAEGRRLLGKFENTNVLLAEDNEMNVEIAKTLLEMCDISVDVARNGQECVELFRQSQEGYYLAILMDIQMPIMNGFTATREIRKMNHKDANSIPIIAMTANAYSSDVGESMAAGMTKHILKPIDISVLFHLLKEYEKAKKDMEQ